MVFAVLGATILLGAIYASANASPIYRRFGLVAGGVLAALSALMIVPPPVLAAESASAEIDQRATDPDQWPAPGRDNKLTRHSDLKDINTENVKKLEMIW
ncbi:MAG: hypothetical protein JJE37_12420, partial [Methyloceanibacter sp.]|nr:hypothetical protein [Methyloceanibacter sp.]